MNILILTILLISTTKGEIETDSNGIDNIVELSQEIKKDRNYANLPIQILTSKYNNTKTTADTRTKRAVQKINNNIASQKNSPTQLYNTIYNVFANKLVNDKNNTHNVTSTVIQGYYGEHVVKNNYDARRNINNAIGVTSRNENNAGGNINNAGVNNRIASGNINNGYNNKNGTRRHSHKGNRSRYVTICKRIRNDTANGNTSNNSNSINDKSSNKNVTPSNTNSVHNANGNHGMFNSIVANVTPSNRNSVHNANGNHGKFNSIVANVTPSNKKIIHNANGNNVNGNAISNNVTKDNIIVDEVCTRVKYNGSETVLNSGPCPFGQIFVNDYCVDYSEEIENDSDEIDSDEID